MHFIRQFLSWSTWSKRVWGRVTYKWTLEEIDFRHGSYKSTPKILPTVFDVTNSMNSSSHHHSGETILAEKYHTYWKFFQKELIWLRKSVHYTEPEGHSGDQTRMRGLFILLWMLFNNLHILAIASTQDELRRTFSYESQRMIRIIWSQEL